MSTTSPTHQTRGYGLAITGTVLHAALVLGLFVIYLVVVPSAKKTFDQFGLTLPWLTLTVIRVSNWVAEYWWSTVPVFLLAGAADFGLLAWLGVHTRIAAVLWMVGFALVLSAMIGITLLGIELPMAKLKEGLAK